MEDQLSEAEREQMRKFVALQKIAGCILRKWTGLLVVAFLAMTAAFSVVLVWHYAYSGHRFNAKTRLLYNPRKALRIDNMSDKQLLSVLERQSLKRRVGTRLPLGSDEKACLTIDLEIVQERKPTNLFTLKANAPTWVGAVKKVNTYAEILIEEYVAYRARDLENLKSSIQVRKDRLQGHIAEIEGEETIAKGKSGVAAPTELLTTINALLSDQRRNLSMLSVQISNEEVKKGKLQAAVGDIGPAVVANANEIRKKSEALAAVDAEIVKLREVYTDLNPKVLGKLDDRKVILEDYNNFLKERGIEGVSVSDIDRIERSAGELAEVSTKLEVLLESRRSLELEIADNEKKSSELVAVIPTLERLRVKRDDLERTKRELEDQLDNITYLQMSVENDLQQIERAGGAGDKNPVSVKNFALAAAGAAGCTLVLAFWLLAIEMAFGKVRGADELAAHGDVDIVGSIPKPGALPEDELKDVLGVIALNYCNVELPKGIVLVCRLPGSEPQTEFRAALDWSLSMAGQRCFVLEFVSSSGFEPPEGGEPMINVVKKGSQGWFPVVNRFSFAPTELQMLQADMAAIREEFDNVFLMMPGGLRKGGSFFSQLLGACESVLVSVGADATPRSELEYVRKHVLASGKPMMGIVTGASAKVVRKEMESRK